MSKFIVPSAACDTLKPDRPSLLYSIAEVDCDGIAKSDRALGGTVRPASHDPLPPSGTVEAVNEATDALLHPLLSSRWSPTTFDQAKDITAAQVESLLEAARWAPSAGNSQPWAFILGRRGEPAHDRLVRHLAKSASGWAPTAGLLVANLSHRFVEDTDWDYSEFCVYDLGQAVAHMSFQAQSLGLHVRQFRAFDRAGLAAEFEVPPHWEVTTMSAIGYVPPDTARDAAASGSGPGRHRRSPSEIRWPQASLTERR